MGNVRDGTVKVYILRRDVRRNLNTLRGTGYRSRLGTVEYISRIERQIKDGEKFLAMLDEAPYSNCKTVDELKQRISRRRNKLKGELSKLDPNSEGHQISIFEFLEETSESEKHTREQTIAQLKEEIHWLHKCLGICKNVDYFK